MRSAKVHWLKVMVTATVILGLIISGFVSFSCAAESANPKVFSRDSVPFGRTYADWTAAWWQWALSVPVSNHPLFDKGNCTVEQTGPVWFLGGQFTSAVPPGSSSLSAVNRTCTVPGGKALFFPVLNIENSLLEDPGKTIAQLRQFPESAMNGATKLSVVVDGHSIPYVKRDFRVQSTSFEFTMPADNLLTAIGEGPFAAGTYSPAVDDGYYVMLQPLPRGDHTIRFKASVPAFDFSLDITYHITVVAP
jgi:hypothetical protein